MPRHEHHFVSSALPDDTFRVVRFQGTEAISQPYRFEIELSTFDPDVEIEAMIGATSTLTMAPSLGAIESHTDLEPEDIHGIVVDMEAVGVASAEADEVFVYRAVLVPRLWKLGLSFQSRIFQHLSVEEIVGQVLSDADVDHDFRLDSSYEPREFTTQYKETDLNFVQRLLEYEGIRYHFEQDEGGETLVMSDATDAPDIPGPDNTIAFFRAGGLLVADGEEVVSAFSARQRLVTGTAETVDYNYRTPSTELKAREDIAGAPAEGISSDSVIHTDNPGRTTDLTKVRAQEIEATRRVMTGASDRRSTRSGHLFTLDNHQRGALNQTYLLTRVEHRGALVTTSGASLGDDDTPHYANTFAAVPASVVYRPPRISPEPKLPGVLTAKVESAGGDYAPIDDQGRYRVRFPFDIGGAGTAQATKPVRLAQPYSGPGYGHHFPVHKDAEMVVACVDGNVDRIIGLSTVPNPNQASPVTSDNQSQNVIRTMGDNELTMDDKIGSENIYMHATKDHNVQVVNDENIAVGTNRTKQVGNDEALDVGRDQSEAIGRDHRFDIGRDQSVAVVSNRTMDIGASLAESVGSNMSLSVGGAKSEDVGASSSLNIGSAYTVSIGATKSESVGAVSTESVGAMKSIEAGAMVSITSGLAMSLTSGDTFDIKSDKDGSVSFAEKGDIQTGKDLTITVGKKAVIEVKDQLTIKCGKAEIVLKKNGDISIKGGKIDIKGSKKMTLKGSQIAEN